MPVSFDLVSNVGTVISRRKLPESVHLPLSLCLTRLMPRPILATIHTEALRHNLARCAAAAPDAKV